MIIALIREAVRTMNYELIANLQASFDHSLKLLCIHFVDEFIIGLTQEPYYLEFKLHLILQYIPGMKGDQGLKTI